MDICSIKIRVCTVQCKFCDVWNKFDELKQEMKFV